MAGTNGAYAYLNAMFARAFALSILFVAAACGSGWVEHPDTEQEVPPGIFDDDTGPADEPICGDMLLKPEARPPNLLLLVDQSGSMNDSISTQSSRTKIDDTKEALNLLLNRGEGSIHFGFMSYPSDLSCGSGQISVACSESSVPDIRARVSSLYPNGGTPTGPALEIPLNYETLHDASRSNFIVLLTDGKPTCPVGNGRSETPEDQQAAIDAAAALHQQAIDTFVVGIGEDLNASNPDVLNQMAIAGGRPRPGAVRYYQANSLDELNAAFDDISQAVFGCTFTLNPLPEDSTLLWVAFDGLTVRRDSSHGSGWDYDESLNQVTVYGPACDLLQAGGIAEVEILMGCAEEYEIPM
jgi:hypothetical protein